jgi:hypothetical protein
MAGRAERLRADVLSGTLDIDVGAGQFTKIDPGIGKLLGVLSLQALPRRLTLDFRDVFSEGFAFDTIAGKTAIVKGVMATDDLRLAGPAARVDISGEADLAKETQRLNVRVLPSLSSTFSAATPAAAMILLAANPLVAAAVGAGTLLAQKVMKDPLEQMFAYDYRISGSWSDPVVERVGARAPPARQARRPRRLPRPRPRIRSRRSARRNDARVSRRRRANGVRRRRGGEPGAGATARRRRGPRSAPSSCCCPSTSASSARIRPTRCASPSATATGRSRRSSRTRPASTASC